MSRPYPQSYPLELFRLNFAFVFRAAEILDRPWPELLLDYTHTFRRFRLGAALNPEHPVWQAFVHGVQLAIDPAEYAYLFYLDRQRIAGRLKPDFAFGCFSYQPLNGGDIRIHFTHVDRSGQGPLSPARLPLRQQEVQAMFAHVHTHQPQARQVLGGSWLYNLPAYRQLFPPAFCASLQPGPYDYSQLSLWGQFLDYRWQVRPNLAQQFRAALNAALTPTDLPAAFPYASLTAAAPVEAFYRYYAVKER